MIRPRVEQYLKIAWKFGQQTSRARNDELLQRIFLRMEVRLQAIKSSMLLNEFDERNFISGRFEKDRSGQ